ncbi:MAG: ATP-binding protein [Litorilituus sp.]|jgi:signal transduction histidine kinase|nr:ATP-binding protein [Litorilituus sp.]
MTRLFISLYFAVTFGLLLIGWSSEQVWRYLQSSSSNEIEQIAKLANTVPTLLESGKLSTSQIEQLISTNINIVDLNAIAWQPEQLKQLQQEKPLLTYNDQDQLEINVLYRQKVTGLNNQPINSVIQIGPIALSSVNNSIKSMLLIASYLLLAGIIALWTWPLWRDLLKLQKATNEFSHGNFTGEITVSPRSVIRPLINSFKSMASQILRLIDEQKQMTNAVSHDLRTPLSRLKFSLAMLDQSQENIPEMKQDVNELEKLIEEMLSYNRLESEQHLLAVNQVDIAQLLKNQIEKLKRNIDSVENHQQKQFELVVNDTLVWPCDGHLIERTTQNLITNAIRYGNTQIKIIANANDEQLLISIEDDGPGIKKQHYDSVFKAFTRLDESRNKSQGGFGLGLAIVQRIAQWHQGECKLSQSSLGGAKFTLIIPKAEKYIAQEN